MCPNCGVTHKMDDAPTLEALISTGIELTRVPDDVEVEFKFSLASHPD